MENEALKVFRVHSRYYSILDESGNGFPSGVGKEFIAQIPSDPAAFQGSPPPKSFSDGVYNTNRSAAVWKRGKIEYFRAEEDRLDGYRQRSPSPDTDRNYWGYSERPSIVKPSIAGRDAWTYIIDLDTDTFIVQAFHIASRTFRLDMIPVSMFAEVSDPSQLMVLPVSQRHMNTSFDFDSVFVELYKTTQPGLHSFTFPTHYSNLVHRQLRRFLMQNFMRHYDEIIHHVNADSQANTYTVRQLVYGLLNLCDPSVRLVFEHVSNSTGYQSITGSGKFAIPSWEPPTSSEYILRSVIIVLEPRMSILEFLQAAIGRAVSMAETHRECRNALIVSIDSVVVVTFTRSGAVDLAVSHTDTLLFCPRLLYSSSTNDHSRGINAVAAVFANNMHEPDRITPPALPAELWEEVFLHSTVSSQDAISRTCRFFRAISDRFPRFDGWTLERPWLADVTGFFAAGDKKDCLIRFFECEWNPTDQGYQTVLWVDGQPVELGIPLLVAYIDYKDWVWPRVKRSIVCG